ncbi:unnamed protein product [Cunninghamella blakesleeana]
MNLNTDEKVNILKKENDIIVDHASVNESIQESASLGGQDSDINIANELALNNDNKSMKVFTIRSVVLGIALSCISASSCQLMQFKPVGTPLNTIFLLMIAYIVCKTIEKYIPQGGWLNPCPFNHKEMTCIYVMVSSANTSAYGTIILSVQALYYNNSPNPIGAILFLIATQCIGYGIAGQLRRFTVYPSKMIWPSILPTVSFIQTLNSEKGNMSKRTKFLFIVFFCIFIYEFIPQYMFPLLGGLSIFCLANRSSLLFQYLFGGLAVNEGLGILQLCFDWNYLSNISPLVLPLSIQLNAYFGIIIGYILIPIFYYYDVWHAKHLHFISFSIFSLNQTTGESKPYPQDELLNPYDSTINITKLDDIGYPHFTGHRNLSYIFTNFALTASIAHVILFYGNDIWKILRTKKESIEDDIHMKLMSAYKKIPDWWFYLILIIGIALNIAIAYMNDSQLPWWGVIIAVIMASVFSLPFNIMEAVTGKVLSLNSFSELIGGLILNEKPSNLVANMYFKTIGYNTILQAGTMASDLKLGHYMKVPPRMIFLNQIIGTIIGCIFNYIVNAAVLNTQHDILIDPYSRSNVWHGSHIQGKNAAAIVWGGIGPQKMVAYGDPYRFMMWAFLIGFLLPVPGWFLHRIYPKAGFNYINIPMIVFGFNTLHGSATSFATVSFIITMLSQWYFKRYYQDLFIRYNYLLSAALDSGATLAVFVISFAFMGAGDGKERPFSIWWGNRIDAKYADYCCMDC